MSSKLIKSPVWKIKLHHVIKIFTYQLCKRQLADTNVLIGRYQLSAKQTMPIIGWLSVHL